MHLAMHLAMYLDKRGSRPQAPPRVLAVAPPPGVNNRARAARWWLSWPVALLMTGLIAGVVFAATDPDWDGTEPKNVSASGPNLARQPAIASSPSGRMVVAWSDQRSESEGAQRNIYAVLSGDNGDTWATVPEAISETEAGSLLPDALVVGDQAFVAWVDDDPPTGVYEAARTETGTWETHYIPSSVQLSNTRPRLAANADRLHVVFNAGKNIPDILYAARPLTAAVWPTATIIYTHTATLGSWYPVLAVDPDGETLHVVWEERASSSQRVIMYMRGTVSGADVDWASPIALSTGITLSLWPTIAADASGNLHVVWGEQVGTGAVQEREQYVRYRRYDAASASWSEPPVFRRIDDSPVRVNQLRPTDISPSLALVERDNQATVCVSWHGFREDAFAEEVLLSCSPDGGQSWEAPRNVSRSPGAEAISIVPSIAFDARGRLHSVWEEHVGGSIVYNYEVYYARAIVKVFLPLIVRS
ncbi:MAG: exo-alpha-sialidase [Anaerolineae bacterium]|nr:exo-alpha-sialidase [Anaerolineae bacterium]